MAECHRLVLQNTGSLASAAQLAHDFVVIWDDTACTLEEFATQYGFANGVAMRHGRHSAELFVGIAEQLRQRLDSNDSAEQPVGMIESN